jgi:hypothetical protein
VNDSTDLETAWTAIVNDGLKGLGLSRKSQRALVRQIAATASYDPEKALAIIAALKGQTTDDTDEAPADDKSKK